MELGNTLPAFERPSIALDELAMLQYMVVLQGVSKGAALSNKNVLANCIQMLDRIGEGFKDGEEVLVCPLPLYHIYAFTVGMMALFASASNNSYTNPRDIDGFIQTLSPKEFQHSWGSTPLLVLGDTWICKVRLSKLHLTMSGGTALAQAAVSFGET